MAILICNNVPANTCPYTWIAAKYLLHFRVEARSHVVIAMEHMDNLSFRTPKACKKISRVSEIFILAEKPDATLTNFLHYTSGIVMI
jgi:hypothetical protein